MCTVALYSWDDLPILSAARDASRCEVSSRTVHKSLLLGPHESDACAVRPSQLAGGDEGQQLLQKPR